MAEKSNAFHNNRWVLAITIVSIALFGLIVTDMVMLDKEKTDVKSTIDCRDTSIVYDGEKVCVKDNIAYTTKIICEGFLWMTNCVVEYTEQPQYSVQTTEPQID